VSFLENTAFNHINVVLENEIFVPWCQMKKFRQDKEGLSKQCPDAF
jgi:hypothetical protein